MYDIMLQQTQTMQTLNILTRQF